MQYLRQPSRPEQLKNSATAVAMFTRRFDLDSVQFDSLVKSG
jgi:hypothetical protein